MKQPKRQNNSPKQKVQISHTQASFYSGKLPPPEMMAQYNSVDPTFADRIIKMAEAEQRNTHKVENRQITTSIIMAAFGMLCGIGSLAWLGYLLFYAIEKENTYVAVVIAGILASVVAIFVLKKRPKEKDHN